MTGRARRRASPRLDRRTFLRSSLLAAGLVACAPRTSTTGPSAVRTGELRMLNWTDYVDLDDGDTLGTVARFAAETGIRFTYDEAYEGNEDLLAILDGWPLGEPEASIVVPTNWLAERLRDGGRLDRLPLELIPNHVNLEPALLGLPWDRGARWHLPWQVGSTGLASGASSADIQTLDQLLDDPGRASIIPEWREAVGLLMLHNGDDPGRADLAGAERALDQVAQLIAGGARVSYDFVELLQAGSVDVAMAWSGDLAFARLEDPGLAFAIPHTGAVRWFDTMVVPTGAPDLASAGEFMDFVYDPANAAALTTYVLYSSPVMGVQDELRSRGETELAEDPLLFPDTTTAQRLVTWGGMTAADEERVEARFTELTAGAPAG